MDLGIPWLMFNLQTTGMETFSTELELPPRLSLHLTFIWFFHVVVVNYLLTPINLEIHRKYFKTWTSLIFHKGAWKRTWMNEIHFVGFSPITQFLTISDNVVIFTRKILISDDQVQSYFVHVPAIFWSKSNCYNKLCGFLIDSDGFFYCAYPLTIQRNYFQVNPINLQHI